MRRSVLQARTKGPCCEATDRPRRQHRGPAIYMYMCIYVYVYICIYVYMYMCICVYMYICICVYMYMCIYVPEPRSHERSVQSAAAESTSCRSSQHTTAPTC